jgi:hypothetical protein
MKFDIEIAFSFCIEILTPFKKKEKICAVKRTIILLSFSSKSIFLLFCIFENSMDKISIKSSIQKFILFFIFLFILLSLNSIFSSEIKLKDISCFFDNSLIL